MTVSSVVPPCTPDLGHAGAYWLDRRAIAYPVDRLGSGVDPEWVWFRLHWGEPALDDTTIGGRSTRFSLVRGAPDGYVALRLDRRTAPWVAMIRRSSMVGLAVSDDAGQLVDATAVRAP